MTIVYYGGPPGSKPGDPGMVSLEQVKTLNFSRQPVYDGPTRLYDVLDYECLAYVNPSVISYIRGAGGVPQAAAGVLPAITDDAIQAYLLEPRRQLVITNGPDTLVSSPPPGLKMDAANGPQPFRCDIMEIHSLKTYVIRFGIRSFINPCTKTVPDTSVILSHRWDSERNTSVDGLSALTIRGHAIVDTAKMQKLGFVPDDFWDSLAHPVEAGFRRANVQVAQDADNRELRYCTVDTEMPMVLQSLKNGPQTAIKRIEASHTASVVRGSVFEALKKEGKDFSTTGAGIGAGIGTAFIPGFGTVVGGFTGWLIGGMIGTAVGTTPLMSHNISVRLWGDRFAPKRLLEQVGRRILLNILLESGVTTLSKKVAGYTNSISRDVAGRFVEIHGTFVVPTLWAALDAAEQGFGFDDELWPKTPANDSIMLDDLGIGITDRVVPNTPLPSLTRGYWLGALAAQALTRTCQRQPAPQNARRAKLALKDTGGLP